MLHAKGTVRLPLRLFCYHARCVSTFGVCPLAGCGANVRRRGSGRASPGTPVNDFVLRGLSLSLLHSSLELGDTKVYEPYIRALLGTASLFCDASVVLKSKTVLGDAFARIWHTQDSRRRGSGRASPGTPVNERLPLRFRDSAYLFMIGNEAGLSMVHAKGTVPPSQGPAS